jgi:hypothetical protein
LAEAEWVTSFPVVQAPVFPGLLVIWYPSPTPFSPKPMLCSADALGEVVSIPR